MALDPNILSRLLGPHPARRMPFDALRAGLLQGVRDKQIHVSREGSLELFSYSSVCQYEKQWGLFSLIARGLILDPDARRVVATPFPKFFNAHEEGITLPDEPFEASEKIDGSLGILFHHNERWRIATRGRLDSSQGEWATKHFHRRADASALVPGMTYLVEIVYPGNRVVIPYAFEGLVLLGAYDEQGHELPRAQLESAAAAAGLRIARTVSADSVDDLLRAAQALTRQEEGFVLRYRNGLRVKLKGEAYCRVHKLICHCTPLALWESMMNQQDLEAMRRELPEEMRRDFDAIRRLLQARIDALLDEVKFAHERLAARSDRDLGLISQDRASGLTEAQKKFVFACRKHNFLHAVQSPGEWREKLFRMMRPDGNHLPGYVPSSAMTRFADEAG